jgi:site-specific DNA-cytosine methylase
MKVLIACEFSGIVREAFAKKGHNAWSCDLLSTEREGQHIQDDVLKHLDKGWDLMIAHPPCTHLAVSGAKYFKQKIADGRQQRAIEFCEKLWNANIPKIALENPIGVLSTKSILGKPSQTIQPFWFGDPHYKSTCLWLKNLPKLFPTNKVEPLFTKYKHSGKRVSLHHYETFYLPKKLRGHVRSITFNGIAEAMAEQWAESRSKGETKK